MKKILFAILLLSLCFASDLRVMFWNVENLFDIENDPKTKDNDFLPAGAKRYTYRSFCLKIQHLSDVINKADPHILAMVEVENKTSLMCLREKMIHADKWDIVIDDGPDIRGIDPALMYRRDYFSYCCHYYYPVFIEERGYHSRPIMRVDLAVHGSPDTLSVFINHWPSRRGGKAHSDKYRLYAAQILLQAIKFTRKEHKGHFMIITGDFNDDRADECLQYLERDSDIEYQQKNMPPKVFGTYYHEGEWIHFDHFLTVTPERPGLEIDRTDIFAPFWIRDKQSNGPFRYYKGVENLGGYSDHFPILMKLSIKRKNVE